MMNRKKLSLEDIFVKLTSEAGKPLTSEAGKPLTGETGKPLSGNEAGGQS
jgi:hypothetical protein